ncbi:MAG: dockerin type I domain-containing protein [Clostridiales bacterium]|jgi:hypothetical protein|nr:dockerin type I domain-containing protein [Clostridiales bacterium]
MTKKIILMLVIALVVAFGASQLVTFADDTDVIPALLDEEIIAPDEEIAEPAPAPDLVATAVRLITSQEVEIACPTKPANAQEVYDTFTVTFDGKEVGYTYLSYFDFGPYAAAPFINIRLDEPLNTGMLTSRTGTSTSPGSGTYTTLGPAAAAKLQVHYPNPAMLPPVTATWASFYAYQNIGSKSKLIAVGTNTCGTLAANDINRVSGSNTAYTYQNVVDYASGGIHRMTGRAEYITQNAVEYGVIVMVLDTGMSVYQAPQWRELCADGQPADWATRRVIDGTAAKPVIVTTADDVMRQNSTGTMARSRSDFFYLGEAFARLFWKTAVAGQEYGGLTLGCERYPRSVYNDVNDFRYDRHVAAAYEEAKKNGTYGGPASDVMKSLEDFFVYGTMVFYEFIPETADGSWTGFGGPVNTREELKRYDYDMYRPMTGIYGEWEYFSAEGSTGFDSGRDNVRSGMPWFWHCQVDNYDVTGSEYPPLDIEHVWVISSSNIEIKFNREVRDMTALFTSGAWRLQRSTDGGNTWTNQSNPGTTGGYLWRALTLTGSSLTTGNFGRSWRGFDAQDIAEKSSRTWITATSAGSTALKRGEFRSLEDSIARGAGMNGLYRVQYIGSTPIRDWKGNTLSTTKTWNAEFMPWLSNAYRSPLTGVYVYGDFNVPESVMKLAGMYYDLGLTNNTTKTYTARSGGTVTNVNYDRPGQRIADYAVAQQGGMQIVGDGHHANQQSRGQQGSSYHTSLYVEGWGGTNFQDQANNIYRDFSMTRYKNEFLVYHEGGHGVDSYTGSSSYANFVYLDISDAHSTATSTTVSRNGGRRWYDENNVGSYNSSRGEYVSTGSTYYHGTMRQSKDGTNDGTWTPISNRWSFWRYDPWGAEAFKRLFFGGDVGMWYENQVGNPYYRVLPGDWKYLKDDAELNQYLTIRNGLYGDGETLPIDSEGALVAWGATVFETLYSDPYNNYSNPAVNWVSWGTPMVYDITRKISTNPSYPNNNFGFLGGIYYYDDITKSFENPFLKAGGVKKPVRTPEEEALLNPVQGKVSNVSMYTPVLLQFDFTNAAAITIDNAQTSFAVKVNGNDLGFRYYTTKGNAIQLYLNWPVDAGDKVELFVGAKAQSATLVIQDVFAELGKTVDVTYKIEGNLGGFSNFSLDLPYESGIYKPVAVTASAALTGGDRFLVFNPNYGTDLMRIAFAATENVVGDGLVFTVTYEIPASAPSVEKVLDLDVAEAKVARSALVIGGSAGTDYVDVDLQVETGWLITGLMGDIDGNGVVTPEDAILLLQMYVGLVDWTPRALMVGDINKDGVVDSTDAALILRMVVGG